ncbi:MAG: HEAT repeat domain-containing protein [bacterium]|nr:HEAT repeat domain-containing protein [bacterium]
MLSALLITLCCFQEPQPSAKPPKPPVAGETAKGQTTQKKAAKKATKQVYVETWDDRRGRDAAKVLSKAFKGKKSSMRDRNKALEAIKAGSNKALVKPLGSIIEKDKSVVLRRRAATLLGNQPAKQANKVIHKLLRNGRVGSHPNIQADLIKSLARCGYESKQWKEIDGLFEQEYALERVPLQEAILDLVAQHKEKQAIPILLRNLDEPTPANVEAADNPPAEYWEARWKSWKSWRKKVKEALFTITGQRFSTAAEAKVWLEKNKLE